MKDFFTAAFPWIITGLCVAVLAVQMTRRGNGEKKETYIAEGMCIGMCLGANLKWIGLDDLGTGMCLGMLIGEVIGMMISKQKDSK